MRNTIPKKALVALPDFQRPGLGVFEIVPPEKAFVPAFDRSFHFGDSVYEVARTYDGILFALEGHMRRLKQSAKLGLFEKFPSTEVLLRMVRETCRTFFQMHGNMDVYVRVTVSRGSGDLNIDPRAAGEPYGVVFVKELEAYPEAHYEKGLHYAVVSRRRNLSSALDPAMKSGNYLNNVLAMAEATRMGAQDAILLNFQGFVTEGTTNNVFIVTREGAVWTPPLSVGILAGITREWVLDVCKTEGIEAQERLFTPQDMFDAREAFMSSSTKEVMPITRLNGRNVADGNPGKTTLKILAAYRKLVAEHVKRHRGESMYQ